ncbi:MAG: hypothetical protein ACKO85_09825 [Isosphaeraceae bacterium]
MAVKSLDQKLAALSANPDADVFILADAKDADMAFGIGSPGKSPEAYAGETRFRSIEEYRDLMRKITHQGLVDIMLMSVSSNTRLTLEERLFEHSHVTPAIRANDTTDVHLARGSTYAKEASRPFRTASLDHAQCGHLDCSTEERRLGANLGLYSVTFNNNLDDDMPILEAFHRFREETERKGFHYFLEVFDPNVPGRVSGEVLPGFINDMITRMLAGIAPPGMPRFLKIVYHGRKAVEELRNYDSSLVVGILGGSAGTTFDAFDMLWDARQAGAKVALYGRKINNAENQLAFIQFLRLIADGLIGPAEAVKAYHAVLAKLGVRPHRSLEKDLQRTDTSSSYAGTKTSATVPVPDAISRPVSAKVDCGCGCGGAGACSPKKLAVPAVSSCGCTDHGHSHSQEKSNSQSKPVADSVFPDFSKMSPVERLAYHRRRLGLG